MSGELANGFGYPLYLFYAPLTYYAGAFLMIFFNLSDIVATKYVYVFPLLIGPFAFYLAARVKMGAWAAAVGAILFALFPYRGTNTYLRGAVAEAWAIAFIPLVFWGIFWMQKKYKFGNLVFSFSLFLVFVSHNIVGMLLGIFTVLYGLCFLRKSKDFWKFFALGILMAAFYLLPMIFYLKQIRVTYLDINKTYTLQTLEPIGEFFKMNFGQLVWRVSGIFSLILIGGLAFFIKAKKVNKEIFFWGVSGLVLYLLLFEPFSFFWKLTSPISGILQFAWRILSLLAFIIPLFLGFWLDRIKSLYFKIGLCAVVVFAVLSFLPSFKPPEYSYYYQYVVAGECATTSWQDEYLPKWVGGCPKSKAPLQTLSKDDADINITMDNSLLVDAQVNANKSTKLIANKFYFPGWHVFVDGAESKINWPYTLDGLFSIDIEKGEHRVSVVWQKTIVMWIADLITTSAFGIFFYLLATELRKIILKSGKM